MSKLKLLSGVLNIQDKELTTLRAQLETAREALEKIAIERVLLAGKDDNARAEAWKGHCASQTQIARAVLAKLQPESPR